MFHKRNSLGGRKVSPPQPTCMTAEQKSTYLDNLRNHRPARPTGSRPAPFASRNYGSLPSRTQLARSDSTPTVHSQDDEVDQIRDDGPPPLQSSLSFSDASTFKARALVQPPAQNPPTLRGRKFSPTATVHVPRSSEDGGYVESVGRKLEKEEAHNLREALEFIDHKDEERLVYQAAQNEAADLVWQHQNPKAAEEEKVAPYPNPDLKSKGRRRSSGTRQASGSRKVSFPTPESKIYEEPEDITDRPETPIQTPSTSLPLRVKSGNSLPWLRKKNMEKSEPVPPLDKGKKFDRFEIHKNPPTQSRSAEYTANVPAGAQSIETIEEVDTPNSQRTLEIRGEDIRAATSMKRKDRSPNLPTPTAVSDQVGRPIVSFDPSWKKLSDSPRTSQDTDRPVIRAANAPASERPLPIPTPAVPEVTVSCPAVPTICLPDDEKSPTVARPSVPVVSVSSPAVPTIGVSDHDAQSEIPSFSVEEAACEPAIPTIALPDNTNEHCVETASTARSNARPGRVSDSHELRSSTRLPWLSSRTPAVPTVSCSSCALPISGRIVTASEGNGSCGLAKARFHPQCFTCHHCATALECVSFYPEPDSARLARLGVPPEAEDPLPPEEVEELLANDPPRFYCHLDFHEFFSPRCRSCKTPIESEVIIACGHHYHAGHFFCAECGDPFSDATPFVEGGDGYAYCVGCHTRRTSARCRECKLPILEDVTVEALGGRYHEACFVCCECGGGFGDDGRFFVRDVEVVPTDKEKRRGISRKMEERAVCGGCEERRLKA